MCASLIFSLHGALAFSFSGRSPSRDARLEPVRGALQLLAREFQHQRVRFADRVRLAPGHRLDRPHERARRRRDLGAAVVVHVRVRGDEPGSAAHQVGGLVDGARRIDVVERPFAHDDKIDRRGGFREAAMHVLLAAAEADDATRWPSSSAFRARRRSISTKSLSTVMPLAISSALRAAPPRTKAVAPGVWLATKLAVARRW